MTKTSGPGSLQKAYPRDFTHLIAEVAETAMKAIVQPDPSRHIQEAAVSSALELKRLRCGLTSEYRRDPALAAAFRYDVVRNRIVRDLATEIVEAYGRLSRTETGVPQAATTTLYEVSPRRDTRKNGEDSLVVLKPWPRSFPII